MPWKRGVSAPFLKNFFDRRYVKNMRGIKEVGALVLTAAIMGSLSIGAVSAQSNILAYNDFEDNNIFTNLGGAAGPMSYDGQHDPTLQVVSDAQRGGYVLKITYSIQTNQWCGYWSYANDSDPDNPPHSTIDVSYYSYLSIWAKGSTGTEDVKIELKTDDNHVSVYTITDIGTSWKQFSIPLASFQKPSWIQYPVDLTHLRMVNLVIASEPWSGVIYVDDIQFQTGTTVVKVAPQTTTVVENYEFSVDVYVEPARPLSGIQATLTYNSTLLRCTGVENGGLLNYLGYENNPGALLLYGTMLGHNYASNPGTFARIRFKALQQGSSTLKLENLKVAAVENGSAVEIPSAAENGIVTIISVPSWDVNMDGRVDILDLVEVGYHYGETGTPGWIRADVNRDGKVDIIDLSIVALHFGE
jgi:hypothetical protein